MPPAWERMIFRSGQRSSVPERASRIAARVVSSRKSATKVGTPGSGSRPGSSDGMDEDDGLAPVQLLEERVERRVAEVDAAAVREQHDAVRAESVEGVLQLDRASRARRAGTASRRSRSAAGWLRTTAAAYSLTSRAIARASASSPRCTPGVETERIAVSTPRSSISASAASGLQSGIGRPPASMPLAAQPGGVGGRHDVVVRVDASGGAAHRDDPLGAKGRRMPGTAAPPAACDPRGFPSRTLRTSQVASSSTSRPPKPYSISNPDGVRT